MSASPISPELQAKIAGWRLKCADGTITPEEMKEAIVLLRQGRLAAASAASSSKKRSTPKVDAPSAASMLDDMLEM